MNRRSFLKTMGCCFIGLLGHSQLPILGRASGRKTNEQKPGFVFILADDLGWVDTTGYGSTFYETPNIDLLASQGMKFINAYAAAPVCSPTRASIMTGQYPARTGVTNFGYDLASEAVTLPEILQSAGYVTCNIGKWHLGQDPGEMPEDQGFNQNIGGNDKGAPGHYFFPFFINIFLLSNL